MNINLKNNIAVYTANFGAYDSLQDPPKEIKGCDFYCFTDDKEVTSETWNIVHIESELEDKVRDARIIKCLPHIYLPEYEYTLWVDANIVFKEHNISRLFEKFLKSNDIAVHLHQHRDCVYDEAIACIERDLDYPLSIVEQIVGYIHKGYPSHNGLAETAVIFRRKTPVSRRIGDDWWQEIRDKSSRDQLSFDFVAWKNKVNYRGIRTSVNGGRYFIKRDHILNPYTCRRKALEFNTMQQELLKKSALIYELKCKKSPIVTMLMATDKKTCKARSMMGRFIMHNRNGRLITAGKRMIVNFFYGKGNG